VLSLTVRPTLRDYHHDVTTLRSGPRKIEKTFRGHGQEKVMPKQSGQYHVGHVQSNGKTYEEPQIQMVTPIAASRAKVQLEKEEDLYKGPTEDRRNNKRKHA
jgi:hypothetical protein